MFRGTALASINKLIINDYVHNCAQPELMEIISTFTLSMSSI